MDNLQPPRTPTKHGIGCIDYATAFTGDEPKAKFNGGGDIQSYEQQQTWLAGGYPVLAEIQKCYACRHCSDARCLHDWFDFFV